MGGGGGGAFSNRSPEQLRALVKKAEERVADAAFETELAGLFGDLLSAYNGRDVATAQKRLNDLKGSIEKSIDGTVDQMFGGSVAKHTYVDGLSDIDALILLNESGLERHSPAGALRKMARFIEKGIGSQASISVGRMAVTVDYGDGMVIQLLPAIRVGAGVIKVPSSRRDGWSEINPLRFREALSRRNQECAGKLVPTIKLAKAINGQLPEAQRLAGYHMESLGIAAFRNYTGEKTTSAMLPTFFERARDLVLSPIVDSTGQSVHVDAYLGPANSSVRQATSHVLSRIARRMRNASSAGSVAQWRALFGFDL